MPEATWHPQKRWGQSFLHDPNIIRKIVELCEIRPGEIVVEIGPGKGALTLPLAKRVKKLIAVEIDPSLVRELGEVLKGMSQVEVVEGDILAFDFSSVAQNCGVEKVKVVGNIPYSISGPILFHLLAARERISTAVVMMQKEVAERLTASPGKREYGVPTVMFATYARLNKAFTVSPSCFHPRPKVTSAVVKMDFYSHPLAPIFDEKHHHKLVRNAFAHKRKTLLNNLLMGYGAEIKPDDLTALLGHLGFDSNVRAENLTPLQFIALSNALVSFKRG